MDLNIKQKSGIYKASKGKHRDYLCDSEAGKDFLGHRKH